MHDLSKTFKNLLILLCCLMMISAFATVNDRKQANNKKQTRSKSITKQAKAKAEEMQQQAYSIMSSLTPRQRSALEERLKHEEMISRTGFGITFYKPTYMLPYYYTGSPYSSVYRDSIPENQKLEPTEFKGQFSLMAPPIFHGIIGKFSTLNVAYTQLSYWQFYAKSQYFRETDYEVEAFLRKRIIPNWWGNLGMVHQSNGRGGESERSWNRIYTDIMFSSDNWMVSVKPWLLIFKSVSSDLHNPNIAHYLGYGRILIAYKLNKLNQSTVSVMARNLICSGFRRPAFEFSFSFPIYYALKGYVQFFSGYGQSLIEYDHRTNSVGIGIALSDWI
jgi:phospholipase A1